MKALQNVRSLHLGVKGGTVTPADAQPPAPQQAGPQPTRRPDAHCLGFEIRRVRGLILRSSSEINCEKRSHPKGKLD